MAVTEYDSLTAAIKIWCARSDSVFSAQVPNFVSMGEDRIYDGYGTKGEASYSPPLRSRHMEATTSIAVTSGSGTLPDDVIEPRKLYRPGDECGITYITPERWSAVEANSSTGTPVYYTIEAGTIKVVPSATTTLSMLYYKRHPAITASYKEGPAILAHGNIYLEAALYEAFSFMQAVDMALAHAARCRSLIVGANRSAVAMRFAGPLRVRMRQPIP
jgi:hypothetical protein